MITETFAELLQRLIIQVRPERAEGVMISITADHGQVPVEQKSVLYLDQTDWYPEIEAMLTCGPDGRPIPPTWSSRCCSLFVKPEKVEAAVMELSHRLVGFADVITVEHALSAGLYGNGPISDKFRRRAGSVLILPHFDEETQSHHHVWWRMGGGPIKHKGMHGGLSPDEMEVLYFTGMLSHAL